MKVCAVIPAAGRGSRLGLDVPKLLVPIAGGATIWSILKDRLKPFVDHIHVVLSPEGAPLFDQALAADPDLLLADEPTGDLDAASAQEIMNLLVSLNSDFGKTIIVVTHDQRVADVARRQLHLDKGLLMADKSRVQ